MSRLYAVPGNTAKYRLGTPTNIEYGKQTNWKTKDYDLHVVPERRPSLPTKAASLLHSAKPVISHALSSGEAHRSTFALVTIRQILSVKYSLEMTTHHKTGAHVLAVAADRGCNNLCMTAHTAHSRRASQTAAFSQEHRQDVRATAMVSRADTVYSE